MCLITKQKVATIIAEDMVVCKFLENRGDHLRPPYIFFKYVVGQLYKTEIKFSDDYCFFEGFDTDVVLPKVMYNFEIETYLKENGYVSIGEGFHSIRLDMVKNYTEDGQSYKCIIPAGSEIFTNEDTGLIVSNQIIVVGLL